jgi:hypothetical protein
MVSLDKNKIGLRQPLSNASSERENALQVLRMSKMY